VFCIASLRGSLIVPEAFVAGWAEYGDLSAARLHASVEMTAEGVKKGVWGHIAWYRLLDAKIWGRTILRASACFVRCCE
jgi:hypothetical protein